MKVPPWTRWWQEEFPCHFSRERSIANASYLVSLLGQDFLADASRPRQEIESPILKLWATNGAAAYVELNALAEDLRTVDRATDFSTVLQDLRSPRLCHSAWHVVHVAAMLGRAPDARVERFFPQTEETVPDFLVHNNATTVAVEAKLLTTSDKERLFTRFAASLGKEIKRALLGSVATKIQAVVVLKDVDDLPTEDEVLAVLSHGLQTYRGVELQYRRRKFNCFLDRTPGTLYAADHGYDILCPKSEQEDLRVLGRGKIASKQLTAPAVGGTPGLFCLGVTRLQSPPFVAHLLERRFRVGQFRGISSVMLVSRRTQIDPPARAPIDLISTIRNTYSNRPTPTLSIRPVGILGNLADEYSVEKGVPAYRYGQYANLPMSRQTGITVPSNLELSADMLP